MPTSANKKRDVDNQDNNITSATKSLVRMIEENGLVQFLNDLVIRMKDGRVRFIDADKGDIFVSDVRFIEKRITQYTKNFGIPDEQLSDCKKFLPNVSERQVGNKFQLQSHGGYFASPTPREQVPDHEQRSLTVFQIFLQLVFNTYKLDYPLS